MILQTVSSLDGTIATATLARQYTQENLWWNRTSKAMRPQHEASASSKPSWTTKLTLGGLCLSILVLRASLFRAPILRDEGLYAYIAQDLLRGHLPLTTALDNKGPFLFYQWAFALWIGGIDSIESVRFLGAMVQIGCTLVLYGLAKQMGTGERAALITAALFVFHTHLIKLCSYYNGSEFYTLLPALLCTLWLFRVKEHDSIPYALAAGVAFGLAIWTRLTIVTWGAFLGLLLLWPYSRRGARLAAAMAVGTALISAVFVAIYARQGAVSTLHESIFVFPQIQLHTSDAFIPESEQLWEVAKTFLPYTVLLWLPALTIACRPSRLGEHRLVLLSWTVVAVLGFWATRLYLPKQLFLVLPPLCLMAAIEIDLWLSRYRKRTWRVAVGVLLLTAAGNVPEHLALMRGDARVSDPMISQGEKVAAWVKTNTEPEDFLYNWGVEWEIYSGAVRRSPTRQVNALLIVMAALAVSREPSLAPVFEKMQLEVVEGIESNPPEVFVLTAGLKNYDLDNFYLPSYLESMLLNDYTLVLEEKPYWVFRRKPDHVKAATP